MSRYYEITVLPPATSSAQNQIWSSYPNGRNDPGALQIELDLLAGYYGVPSGEVGNSTVTIHGVPLSTLQQAQNYYMSRILVKGGMKAGLPLAQPWQSGLLLQGTIFQSFGNWQGTEMNISFVVSAQGYSLSHPGNFVLNWQAGQSLAAAISNALSVVYPSSAFTLAINIADAYATSSGCTHIAADLVSFSQLIHSITNGKVNVWMYANIIHVGDGSTPPETIVLAFNDLIGQPKWVGPNMMQFTCVMRADIQVGSIVKMPLGLVNAPGTVTTSAASTPSQLKYRTSFQGNFVIYTVRHVGNFRDPDGAAWATIYEAKALT